MYIWIKNRRIAIKGADKRTGTKQAHGWIYQSYKVNRFTNLSDVPPWIPLRIFFLCGEKQKKIQGEAQEE